MEGGDLGRPETLQPTPLNRRVVLLGASNLAVGLSPVISAAQAAWGRPLEIMTALGHGRGYGLESRVLGRILPPILECGLWADLEERAPIETASLVTDIGNDLVYGALPEQVVEWTEVILCRLKNFSSDITVSQLPLDSLERVGPLRYQFFRSVVFPGSKLTLDDALQRAAAVNAAITQLAGSYGASVITPHSDWYGFDPIHIRRSASRTAWSAMFSLWKSDHPPTAATRLADSRWYLHRLRPLQRTWFGTKQVQTQPAGILKDGSTLSLY